MSVNPYSRASCAELTDRWFDLARSGSKANAAMARPTYRGDSDEAIPPVRWGLHRACLFDKTSDAFLGNVAEFNLQREKTSSRVPAPPAP